MNNDSIATKIIYVCLKILKNKALLTLTLLTLFAACLHLYNLNWGAPYYFHPDERNIASSVSQLNFPTQMNPNFFAYGSLPIYTIYFTGRGINFLMHSLSPKPYPLNPSFTQAILISRFYSALFATLLIPILFFLARSLKSPQPHSCQAGGLLASAPLVKGELENITKTSPPLLKEGREDLTAWISAILATFSVGFIQFAHFGTFEMWLTFFTVLLFWLCLRAVHNHTATTALLLGIVFGILVATKVSHIALLPLPAAIVLFRPSKKTAWKHHFLQLFKNFRNFIIFLLTICVIYILTNPFVFLDTPQFLGSMRYESGVGLGTLTVFYTGEFFGKLPIIFQFLNIYPFLINPIVTIIFIPAFFYVSYLAIKTRNSQYLILNTFFLFLFFSQTFFFAKWTRYMLPTLPFIYLIIAITITSFVHNRYLETYLKAHGIRLPAIALATAGGTLLIALFSLSYFIVAFVEPDTRLQAKQFAVKTIRADSPILSEVYDLGITPFNDTFHDITLFNFYDLDNNSPDVTPQTLQNNLQQSSYIILPSQRILKTRLLNKQKFPNGYQFYNQLTHGILGYKKIYETPCDILCRITYLGSPTYSFEETANVFDRPEISIFKKI